MGDMTNKGNKQVVFDRITVYNLAKKPIHNFPSLAVQYPHIFVLNDEMKLRMVEYLKGRSEFTRPPEVYKFGEKVYDWDASTPVAGSSLCYVGISERVFADIKFKEMIVEMMV